MGAGAAEAAPEVDLAEMASARLAVTAAGLDRARAAAARAKVGMGWAKAEEVMAVGVVMRVPAAGAMEVAVTLVPAAEATEVAAGREPRRPSSRRW